ncbi:MAG TPA: GGDEF domain-containing protein [Gammaproteobacteria bacterium]|nr:GGDEF domain-containing protein [Gammaproteobacteria bacterium]
MSRSALLLLCLLVMSMLMGVLVLVVARGERKSLALRLWGWGLVAYAFGMLTIIAAAFLPWGFTQVAGNTLISLAALLTSRGVFMHVPRRPSSRLTASALLVVIAVLVVNHLLNPHLIIDIAAPTLYGTLLYALVSWQLVRHPPPAAKAASRFLVTTILLTLVVWNLRLALLWISLGGSSDPARADALQAGFAVFQMLLVVSSTLGLVWVEVRLMEDDLRRSAFTDLLTGLPNRRAMLLRFDEEVARCNRQGETFGLALFDIDLFKQINDTCGHYVGDTVLKNIAATLERSKRSEDLLGRLGGEEFMVILPHHRRETSIRAAERLRQAIEDLRTHEDAAMPTATISAGVAVYPDDGNDWDRLFMAADRRLYRAKNEGRNRVVAEDKPVT